MSYAVLAYRLLKYVNLKQSKEQLLKATIDPVAPPLHSFLQDFSPTNFESKIVSPFQNLVPPNHIPKFRK